MSEKLTEVSRPAMPAAAVPDGKPVSSSPFAWSDRFEQRHIGPTPSEVTDMLRVCGFSDLDALIDSAVPARIRSKRLLNLPASRSEYGLLTELKAIAAKNRVFRSCIGTGYSDCITPPVIQRNILENPGWYTQYTPYQAEIAQGRLEALLNFQTMVIELTGMEIANASLLDEGTAAAEAMFMQYSLRKNTKANVFFVSEELFPQTIDILKTRSEPYGIKLQIGNHANAELT